MAEPKIHPELTITQVPLTEGNTAVSLTLESLIPESITSELITNDSIKKATSFVLKSSNDINEVSPKIVLATLNARFFHTSFGLPKHN